MVDLCLEKQKFFLEGSKSYFNAQRAIKEYEGIIEREIRKVLKSNLEKLRNAVRINEIGNPIQYIQQDFNEGWCRVGISFDIPDCGKYYVFAEITENGLFATTILGTWYASWRDRIMGFVNNEPDLNKIFKCEWQNEIYSQQKVDSADIQTFRDKIVENINFWIRFWEKVGGTKYLKDS